MSENVKAQNAIPVLEDFRFQELNFEFDACLFLRENVYNSEFVKGNTALGNYFLPMISYGFSSSTRLKFGAYMQYSAGDDAFSEVLPYFQIRQRITRNFELLLGNIEGNLNHNLYEPLYQWDNFYLNNQEYGAQFLLNTQFVAFDAWLNWIENLVPGVAGQEEFEVGLTSKSYFKKGDFSLFIPLQGKLTHQGGEGHGLDQALYFNVLNMSSGLGAEIQLSSFVLRLQALYFLYYKAYAWGRTNHLPYDQGNASYLIMEIENKSLFAQLGFWNAYRFIAPNGEPHFSSVGQGVDPMVQENRELIKLGLGYGKVIFKGINFKLRFDGYYDLTNDQNDYAVSLLFRVNTDFILTKLNQ